MRRIAERSPHGGRRPRSRDDVTVVIASAHPLVRLGVRSRLEGHGFRVVEEVATADELPAAVMRALEGDGFVAVGAEEAGGADDELVASLSERELSMLRTLARGLSNKAIGNELWITEQTVKFHLTNIYRKLSVGNRTEAVRLAYQHGLIENPLYESQ